MKIRNRRIWVSVIVSAVLAASLLGEPLSVWSAGEQAAEAETEAVTETEEETSPAQISEKAGVQTSSGEQASGTVTSETRQAAAQPPAAKETVPEKPAAKQEVPKTPAVKQETPETPAVKQETPETPAAKETAAETPAAKETAAETPVVKEAAPETPAAEQEASDQPEIKQEVPEVKQESPEQSADQQPEISLPETMLTEESLPETQQEQESLTGTLQAGEGLPEMQQAGEDLPEALQAGENLPEMQQEQEGLSETQQAEEKLAETQQAQEGLTEIQQAEDLTEETLESGAASADDPSGETGNTEDADESGNPEDTGESEAAEETEETGNLGSVMIAEDVSGAYCYFEFRRKSKPSVLTLTLTDGSGNQVGGSITLQAGEDDITRKSYLLPLTGNAFGLSLADMGKSVSIHIAVESEAGNETAVSPQAVTLRLPSMSLPSMISFSAVSAAGDLLDAGRISGLSFDPGSCTTQQTVEKNAGGAWTTMDNGASAGQGTYRVRLHTVLGDFYSNECRVVAPATGLEVEGDMSLGSVLTAKPQGINGVIPEKVDYAWSFGESGTVVCTDQVYTASLKDAVAAQTCTLFVSIIDEIGNKFTKGLDLSPLDLSMVSLTLEEAEPLVYTGESQIPLGAQIALGDFVIPQSLYTTSAAEGKNATDAGNAWMRVTGSGTYLTNSADVSYRIKKDEQDIEEEDFIVSFKYDGEPHKPVLKDLSETAGKIKYKKWQQLDASGSWVTIKGAPEDGGTYRVNIIVKSADSNYKKAEFEEVVFTITGGRPAPEPSTEKDVQKPKPQDLTVTDAKGNPAGYQTRVISAAASESDEAVRVFLISADPLREKDGSVKRDEAGKALYRQRNLHITPDLIRRAQDNGCSVIRFTLGDASVQADISMLQGTAACTLRLAPIENADLTEKEKEVLADRTGGALYALRIVRDADGEDVTEQIASAGVLEVMLDVTGGSADTQKEIFFLKEKRGEQTQDLTVTVIDTADASEEGRTCCKGAVTGSGLFGLA